MTVPDFVRALTWDAQDPVALFDADGCLWRGDVSYSLVERLTAAGKIDAAATQRVMELEEEDPAEAAYATIGLFAGMNTDAFAQDVADFWRDTPPAWVPKVVESFKHLVSRGVRTYVVSASATPILRPLEAHVPVTKICGLELEVHNGVYTGKHTGIATVGEGKAKRAREEAQGTVVFAIGNSEIDAHMLELSTGIAWAFEPSDTLRAVAEKHGWRLD